MMCVITAKRSTHHPRGWAVIVCQSTPGLRSGVRGFSNVWHRGVGRRRVPR